MEEYRSEDEQVEALKRWWRENGVSTITAVALALAGVLGWQAWQKHEQTTTESASMVYQNLLQALETESKDSHTTAITLSDTLKRDFDGTRYALLGQLAKARLALESGDVATAEAELRAVLGAKPDPAVAGLASLRLARVLAAKPAAEEALALLETPPAPGFAAPFAEARGDILATQGKQEDARKAYAEALELVRQSSGGSMAGNGVLELKLQSVGGSVAGNESKEG